MIFFLGTHQPQWLADARFSGVPLFISRRALQRRASFPSAVTDFALDLERIADLATGNPRPLSLVATIAGTVETERVVHWIFRGLRERGEWFRYHTRMLAWLACYADEMQP